jgi:hypothetical protein
VSDRDWPDYVDDVTFRGKSVRAYATVVGVAGAVLAFAGAPALATASDPVPSFNGTVLTVAYSGSTLYLGGDFTTALVKGKPFARSHLAAVNARTGTLLPWAPAADGRVKALAVSGSSIYVAGDFARVGGQSRDSVARIDAIRGTVSPTFKHSISGRPSAVVAASGRLYLGGSFSAVDGQTRTRLAAFNLTTGALDTTWRPTADDQVTALAAGAGRIYAGGKFRRVNGKSGYERLVALDPAGATIVPGFKPRPAAVVFGITATSDSVYTANGGQGGLLNSYTIAGVNRWTATFDGDAQAVTTLNGRVYVGGHFDRACRTARTGAKGICLDGSDDRIKLAALDPRDGHLLEWTADANGVEGVLTLAGSPGLGAIAAGGAFTTIEGRPQKRLAQIR